MTLEEVLDSCAANLASAFPEMNFVVVGRHEGVIMHSNTPMHEDEVIHLCMSAAETEVFGKKRFLESKQCLQTK